MADMRDARPRHWLYAFGTTAGVVKIGRTAKPQQRLIEHKRIVGGIEWFHFFGSDDYSVMHVAERVAIDTLALVGRRVKYTESFTGLDRASVIAIVRPLIEHARLSNEQWWKADAALRAEQAAWDSFRAKFVAEASHG